MPVCCFSDHNSVIRDATNNKTNTVTLILYNTGRSVGTFTESGLFFAYTIGEEC